MSDIIPRHQWTHDGVEVLIVKWVPQDGYITDYGFQWPLTVGAIVEAPDWNPAPQCGGGLHGWPWGFCLGEGKESNWTATWLVFAANPVDVVSIEGKCKARAGVIRYVGDWQGAVNYVLSGQIAWVAMAARGASSATGYRGASSATGYRGASSATGYQGVSSATGYRGASSATGYRGASSATGDCSAAIATGYMGRARAGQYSCIALAWHNSDKNRYEMRCAETGCGDGRDGKLKAKVWYQLDKLGRFQEIPV